MRIFERYLARQALVSVGAVLGAFAGLLVLIEFIYEMQEVGKPGYGWLEATLVTALRLPSRLYEIVPIAALIGILVALANLARHSELAVLRVSGVSTARLLLALSKAVLPVVVVTFLLGEVIAPACEQYALTSMPRAADSPVSKVRANGVWMRDGNGFVNARSVLPGPVLKDIRLFQFDAGYRLESASRAREGRYENGRGWVLSDVQETRYAPDGSVSATRHDTERDWAGGVSPEVLGVLNVMPERMSLLALSGYIRHLWENHQSTGQYEAAFWKKLIYPFSSLVMMVLALPFAYNNDRRAGVGFKVFLGVMLGIAFYMGNGLLANLGGVRAWPAFVTAVLPTGLTLLLAAVMLYQRERR